MAWFDKALSTASLLYAAALTMITLSALSTTLSKGHPDAVRSICRRAAGWLPLLVLRESFILSLSKEAGVRANPWFDKLTMITAIIVSALYSTLSKDEAHGSTSSP